MSLKKVFKLRPNISGQIIRYYTSRNRFLSNSFLKQIIKLVSEGYFFPIVMCASDKKLMLHVVFI